MSRCLICSDPIGVQEPRKSRRDAATGVGHPVHTACTRLGVERWNRENRPHGGPLEAARKENWTWTGDGPDRPATLSELTECYRYADLFHDDS